MKSGFFDSKQPKLCLENVTYTKLSLPYAVQGHILAKGVGSEFAAVVRSKGIDGLVGIGVPLDKAQWGRLCDDVSNAPFIVEEVAKIVKVEA